MGDDARVLAVEVLVRPRFPAAGREHRHAIGNGPRLPVHLDFAHEAAHGAHGGLQLGVFEHLDVGVQLHLLDQAFEVRANGLALVGGVHLPGVAAETVRFFEQHGLEALVGKAHGRGHAGHPAADDERLGHHVDPAAREGNAESGFGNGHAHLVLGLFRGLLGLALVHPGVLVADVGHLHQVGVQARLPQGVLEQRLVGTRGAGRDDDPVQPVLADLFRHELLGVGRAAEEVVFGQHHVGQAPGILGHLVHVDHAGDVDAAGADKDTDARLVAGDTALAG